MDDELEDKVLYQTYLSYMKLMSKLAVGLPTGFTSGINTPLGYFWKMIRSYALRPEIVVCGAVVLIVLLYLQAVDAWSRSFIGKIHYTVCKTNSKVSKLQYLISNSSHAEKLSWELKQNNVAAYAVQGYRDHMEDRFIVNDNIEDTGVSLFAVFDGHGGEFAANYARDKLIPNINKKVIELKNLLSGKAVPQADQNKNDNERPKESQALQAIDEHLERRKSFKKAVSTTDECIKNTTITDPELLGKLDSLLRPITREVKPTRGNKVPPREVNISSYIEGQKINYGKLLTDEVIAADNLLVEAAKKNMNVAGTTALIVILDDNKLIVANVGDSRGVMCDSKGNAIPLSFDHKPQQQRERQRINKAGGMVTFNGVWRVAGILATSRALGDYPLKDKKLVIADPDILTFDLKDHDPMFLILASDGLWDTFSNEEAVAFIKERLGEPHYGAKSITLQSYYRGSLDNITVVVINLKDRKYSVSEYKKHS
ncbi:protein phosphatase 1L [Chelonus insularis]|uniref:protein phosphatase 1L n=1 Tax=Chelonus insularis TaxID=460826 RepID=UPI00158F11F8|nr:protein phosphatase 1L [Chelonus insularis]XP_034950106.1 protein phosphatase 1L [Chelonus insularis]